MALQRNASRQSVLEAIIDIGFADPVAYGTAENAIQVPANAILVGGDLTVLTAWNSATSASLTLGDATVTNRYANAIGTQRGDWTDQREPHENPRQGSRTKPGTIALQGHDPTTDLLFRNIRVGEL